MYLKGYNRTDFGQCVVVKKRVPLANQ